MSSKVVRHVVMGRWHPEVDVNAVHIDSEPTRGIVLAMDQRKRAATYRKVSAEMGALIRNQEMCWYCLQEFPCPMRSGERVSIWNEAITRGEFRCAGPISREVVLTRAANRQCPMCIAPISDVAIETDVRVQRADEKSQA